MPEETLKAFRLPETGEYALPILEVLPLQLMTIALADFTGVQAGIFRNIGKVTKTE